MGRRVSRSSPQPVQPRSGHQHPAPQYVLGVVPEQLDYGCRLNVVPAHPATTELRCFVCHRPARESTRLATSEVMEHTKDRPVRLPREAGLCEHHARSAGSHLYFGVRWEGNRLFCISLSDGVTTLTVERATKRGHAPSRIVTMWRERLVSRDSRCLCGRRATQLGHRIPLVGFRLSALPAGVSYFRENLDAVCPTCNDEWMHFCYPPTSSVWAGDQERLARYYKRRCRLRSALAAARRRGIPVVVPCITPSYGWPANPVFDTSIPKLAGVVRPVAFVENMWIEGLSHPRFLGPGDMSRLLHLPRSGSPTP